MFTGLWDFERWMSSPDAGKQILAEMFVTDGASQPRNYPISDSISHGIARKHLCRGVFHRGELGLGDTFAKTKQSCG